MWSNNVSNNLFMFSFKNNSNNNLENVNVYICYYITFREDSSAHN